MVTKTGPALVREGGLIPLWRSVNLVGREDPTTGALPDIDLTALDERRAVSRKHARLDYRKGVVTVSDLGSTNGTFVNEQRLPVQEDRRLEDGDRVRFGRVELVYREEVAWPAGVSPEWESRTVELSRRDALLGDAAPTPDDRQRHRVLATVMFTDIANSTTMASSVGDRRWRELLTTHHNLVRRELNRFDGREVRTAGDGFMATFASPASGVRCGCSVIEEVKRLGLQVRVGLHTGEVEIWGDDIQGIAVHIAARVAAKASPDEILVSATIRDIVAGSGIQFSDRGYRNLKGVPGKWRLFAAQTASAGAKASPG
jgi:class 3 adenylate cyclase